MKHPSVHFYLLIYLLNHSYGVYRFTMLKSGMIVISRRPNNMKLHSPRLIILFSIHDDFAILQFLGFFKNA